jgi:hypothetical protein
MLALALASALGTAPGARAQVASEVDVDTEADAQLERLAPAVGRDRLVAEHGERGHQRVGGVAVVIDDEDALHAHVKGM